MGLESAEADEWGTSRIVTLLTDFGHRDPYVGIMKGVILSINPEVRIVDLCHEIRPQRIRQAAFLLMVSRPYFPAGSIHVVVVDPGVGSGRRSLAVRSGDSYFVGPDNGVLSWVREEPSVAVEVRPEDLVERPVSATFHGRDVFSPVAAHLSLGFPISGLGPPAGDIIEVARPRLDAEGELFRGEILHVDRFGNLVTSIPGSLLCRTDGTRVRVDVGRLCLTGIRRTFADGEDGEFIAYVGSAGYLEIARVRGDAEHGSGCTLGDEMSICFPQAG